MHNPITAEVEKKTPGNFCDQLYEEFLAPYDAGTLRVLQRVMSRSSFPRNFPMRAFATLWLVALLAGSVSLSTPQTTRAADDYAYDLVHSSVSFKARHLDISWIHGRFNQVDGKFSIDRQDPTKSKFELTIQADSVDTGNKARDEHLRQPDYFDTKQFPTITFKSTSTKVIKDGYEVTGDFTMHGVTKKVTINLQGGKEIEFNKKKIVAFSTEVKLKRSDFGFDKTQIGLIGDEALIMIDCEGTRS